MVSNKYINLFSNTAIFAIGNILVKIISFLLMPLYTAVLTTEQYGVSELLNSSIEIILPIVTCCIIESLYRFSIDKDANHRELFSITIKIILISDLVVAGIVLIALKGVHYQYADSFLLLYITITFYKLVTQFARGLGHVKRYAFYGVLNAGILIISNVILLVYLKGGIEAYLTSFSLGYGISGIVAFFLSKEYQFVAIRSSDRKLLQDMLIYSLPIIPNMISWWINSISGRYIVMLYWGPGIAGLYTAASKLPAMINLMSSVFQQAWQYSTAVEIQSKNPQTFFSIILRGYIYICTLVCAILILCNKLICMMLLQSDFYVAWKFIPLLLLAATFGCISMYFGTFYQALKSNMMLMFSTIIGAVFNVMLNFIFIPSYGGLGAAFSMMASYFVVMLIRAIDIQKKIEILIDWKKVSCQIIPLTCLTIVATINTAREGEILVGGLTLIILLSDINLIVLIVKSLKSLIIKRRH